MWEQNTRATISLVSWTHGSWSDKSTLRSNLHIEQKLCLSKNCHYPFFLVCTCFVLGVWIKEAGSSYWLGLLPPTWSHIQLPWETLHSPHRKITPIPTLTSGMYGGPCGIARQGMPLLSADQINPTFPIRQPDIQSALPTDHCCKCITLRNTLTVNLILDIYFS